MMSPVKLLFLLRLVYSYINPERRSKYMVNV
jgi:hypothetical protein